MVTSGQPRAGPSVGGRRRPGIAEADLPHVFERLYVAEHSPAVQESGSGLGLAIVRDLTERMGVP